MILRIFKAGFLVLLAGMSLVTTAFGQAITTDEGQPLSRSQAIEMGLKNNFQIQISEANLESAQLNNTWKNTSRHITIDFNINSNQTAAFISPGAGFFQEDYENYSLAPTASIDLSWTLFDGYKARINKTQFEMFESQQEVDLALSVEESIQAIINAYNQALLEGEQLEVLGEILSLSRDRIDEQEIRREFGQAGRFEIVQAKDAYFNDSINYVLQENVLDNSLRNLKLTIGEKDLDKKYTLTDSLSYKTGAYDYSALRRQMLANNNGVKGLQVARELARVEKELAESDKSPSINLGTGLQQGFDFSNSTAVPPGSSESFGTTTASNTNLYLQLSLNYRLYDAGRRKRAIESAEIQERVADLDMADLQRNLSTQLKNTLATYENQRQIVQLTETLILNARENLDIAEERFKRGQINSFDFRSVQLGLANASQSRLSSIFNLLNTETELIRLIGGLVR